MKFPPKPPQAYEKRHIYDEARGFLGNCKTVRCKDNGPQEVIDGDLEEGLLPGPLSVSELSEIFHHAHLNSSGAEIKDPAKPDVRTLVEAAQGLSAATSS